MAEPTGFAVRPPKNADEVLSLWWPNMQSLGWNRTENDHETHWHSSRGGYLVLAHKKSPEEQETPVGIVMPIIYPNKTGWIGFFIVEEAYRGTGGGRILLQVALDLFKKNEVCHVGLDGVLQQVPTYQRRGFIERGRIKLMTTKPIEELVVPVEIEEKVEEPTVLKSLSETTPAAIVAADERVTGLRRVDLWTEELLKSRADAWGAAVESRDGKVLGYLLVRSCEHGYRVGPLYAEKWEWAKVLLHEAMKRIKGLGSAAKGKSLIAEVWGENPKAVNVFEQLGWEYAGVDYARMWLEGRTTYAQESGGVADREAFAFFDAGEG